MLDRKNKGRHAAKPIFAFKNAEIQALYEQNKLPAFYLTKLAKDLFKQGSPGQGYVGFVDLESGEIHLIPAFNKNDGKEHIDFICQGKNYTVVSEEPLGSNSGRAHIQGLATLGLGHKGNANGKIVGFGIFKGDAQVIEQFRNNSYSQNRFAIEYSELFLMCSYLPTATVHLVRALPLAICELIQEALLDGLPKENEQKREIKEFTSFNGCWEERYQLIRDKVEQLKTNLIMALITEEEDSAQRIYELIKKIQPTFDLNLTLREDAITRICEEGRSLNERFPNNVLLNILVQINRPQAINRLTDLGYHMDINNIHPDDGLTPLHFAILHQDIDFINILLSRSDIDVNVKNREGDTPLMQAIKSNQLDVVKLLLACDGIEVNALNSYGVSPLLQACLGKTKQHRQILKLLLAHPHINVNLAPKNRPTPLIGAALRRDHVEVVALLLAEKNIEVNAKYKGLTALMHAVSKGNLSIVKALLAHKDIDISYENSLGETALSIAKEKGYTKIATKLKAAMRKTSLKSHPVPFFKPKSKASHVVDEKYNRKQACT